MKMICLALISFIGVISAIMVILGLRTMIETPIKEDKKEDGSV